MLSFFNQQQIILLVISISLLLVSVFLFPHRTRASLFLLTIGTFILGYFMIVLDPFLILWDEQFHALVAKNMVDNPFQPMLYKDPILDYSFKSWPANHIWLHKQPLFLWLMSLSIKFLGATTVAVRMPSIIMHAIIPLFIYRIGTISMNTRIGYGAALFFAVAYFPLELCVGRYCTDHNDAAFLFFITGSIWSWFEYQKSKDIKWLIGLAIFSGCAVLVKWLMGLLIYVIWTIVIFFTDSKRWQIISYVPIIIGFSISVSIFLPWQIYIFMKFPQEAYYEMLYNGKHFFEVIEGHSAPAFFYFTKGFEEIYGEGVVTPFFYLAGFIMLIIQVKEKKYKIALSATVLFVYVFYSVAQTKMIAFPIIVSPIIFLGLAVLVIGIVDGLKTIISNGKIGYFIQSILILVTAFFLLDFSRIENNHTMKSPKGNYRRELSLKEMEFIQALKKDIPEKNTVIFNADILVYEYVRVMFFTDFIAYRFIPTKEQMQVVKSKGYKIAVIDNEKLPEYLLEDETIILLPTFL